MFCGQSTASNLATMISFLACAFKVDYQGTFKIPLDTEVSQQDNTQDSWRRKWLLCLDWKFTAPVFQLSSALSF